MVHSLFKPKKFISLFAFALVMFMSCLPVFAVEIPLIGSLANIIGIFLGAVVAGIAGALMLNLIDRIIADKQRQTITKKQIEKGNEILDTQMKLKNIAEVKLDQKKMRVQDSITERHVAGVETMKKAIDEVRSNMEEDPFANLRDLLE